MTTMNINGAMNLEQATQEWQELANRAYKRVLDESGLSPAQLGGKMNMRPDTLGKMCKGKRGYRWTLPAFLRLAAVTQQHPGAMLARELANDSPA